MGRIKPDEWEKSEILFDDLNPSIPRTMAKWRSNDRASHFGIMFSKLQIFGRFPLLDKESRISLQDFLHVEAVKIGWGKRPGDQNDLADLIDRIRRAAVDDELHLWGRNPGPLSWHSDIMARSPLVRIPSDYWQHHEVEYTTAIFAENTKNYSQRVFGGDERYHDLHLGRHEAMHWLNEKGRP